MIALIVIFECVVHSDWGYDRDKSMSHITDLLRLPVLGLLTPYSLPTAPPHISSHKLCGGGEHCDTRPTSPLVQQPGEASVIPWP